MAEHQTKVDFSAAIQPLREQYERMQVSPPIEPVAHDDYCALLRQIEPRIHSLKMRLFTTTFDPHKDEVIAFPRSSQWHWQTLGHTLTSRGAAGVLVRLPLFWQTEPLIFAACRAAGAFPFINDAANMPVGRMGLEAAGMNTILTAPEDAAMFGEYLVSKNLSALYHWVLVYSAEKNTFEIPDVLSRNPVASITREIHLFPGIPIFFQCRELADTGRSAFHLAEGYDVCLDENDKQPLLAGTKDDALPLLWYKLPWKVSAEPEKCSCGKTVLSVPHA